MFLCSSNHAGRQQLKRTVDLRLDTPGEPWWLSSTTLYRRRSMRCDAAAPLARRVSGVLRDGITILHLVHDYERAKQDFEGAGRGINCRRENTARATVRRT